MSSKARQLTNREVAKGEEDESTRIMMMKRQEEEEEKELTKMKTILESINDKIRVVKLRQNEASSKLGFSLRGGKEATGSSVGVFVSHVERHSEAEKKGLKIGDQLIQVNGLNVNQATYEEVICLIRQTPKRQDILLKVNNLGRIPFQEKLGDPIKWLQVLDVFESELSIAKTKTCADQAAQHGQTSLDSGSSSSVEAEPLLPIKATASSLVSSSDDGIDSCESQRGNSLWGECELEAAPSAGQSSSNYHHRLTNDDSALSSTLTSSSCSASSSSACSISMSSVQSSDSSNCLAADDVDENDDDADLDGTSGAAEDTLIKVPGGKRTSEPFGCGVVKGPDEWPGIFVQNVKPASLAERVGLEPGDQLIRADGQILLELSFDVAIGLIKRLQQQQDELLLHVRKGAALKYLATNKQRAAGQSNLLASQQQQRQEKLQQQHDSSSRLTTSEEASDRLPLFVKQGATSLQAARSQRTVNEASPALYVVQRRESPANKGNRQQQSSTSAAAVAHQASIESSPPADREASDKELAANDGDGEAESGRGVFGCDSKAKSSNPISGTQSQLSGKQELELKQDRGNSNNNEGRRVATTTTTPAASQDVNMEIRNSNNNKWSSSKLLVAPTCTKSSRTILTNQFERGQQDNHRADKRHLLELSSTLSGEIHSRSRLASSLVQSSSSVVAKSRKQQLDHHNHQQQQSNQHSNQESLDSSSAESRHHHQHLALESKQLEFEEEEEEDGEEECSKMRSGYEEEQQQQQEDGEEGDNREEEEIRIVSQNCKLHHHLSVHNFSKSTLVHEKFPHPAARLQQQQQVHKQQRQQQQQQQVTTTVRTKVLAPTPRRRQTVDDMRRQLDSKARGSLHSTNHQLLRYVSMDNLMLAGEADCQRRLRSSSSSRQDEHETLVYGYTRPVVVASNQQQHRSSSSTSQRIYRRSNSVLGQPALCCVGETQRAGNSTTADQVQISRCSANGEVCTAKQNRLQSSSSQCCLLQQQQQHVAAYSNSGRKYSNTLSSQCAPFALSRSKAHSMDKLNMHINLNYVKMSGLQNPTSYRIHRQQLVSGSSQPTAAATQKRLHRRLQDQQHCCAANIGPMSCLPGAMQAGRPQVHHHQPTTMYNYATASGVISSSTSSSSSSASSSSSVSVAASRSRARQQQSTATCCAGQQAIRAADCTVNKHVPIFASCQQQSILVAHHTIGASQRISCCAGSATTSVPALYNGNGKGSSSTIWASNRSGSSAYSCCAPLRCCSNHQQELICSSGVARADQLKARSAKTYTLLDTGSCTGGGGGTTTDSSGYLSGERRSGGQPRLLKVCSQAHLLQVVAQSQATQAQPPQPPPPPPMFTVDSNTGGKSFATTGHCLSQQRDTTRQRMSTFLSTTSSSSCSPPNNQQHGRQIIDEISPTCTSSSYSPDSTTCSMPSDSSLSAADPSGIGKRVSVSPTHLICRQPGVGKRHLAAHQLLHHAQQRPASKVSSAAHIPCPPPMPAQDAEFDCKMRNILKQDQSLNCLVNNSRKGSTDETTTGESSGGRSSSSSSSNSSSISVQKQQQETIGNKQNNRLCFVDELKMLAKRQRQQQQQKSSNSNNNKSHHSSSSVQNRSGGLVSPDGDSCTLIKIINASKSVANSNNNNNNMRKASSSGGCNCQQQQQRAGLDSGGGSHCQQEKCMKSSHKSSHESSSKSVKLEDEDNKRRQHEMLMKEFKSAHSKMFSKRRANANQLEEDEKQKEQVEANQQQQQQQVVISAATDRMPPNRSIIKTTRKINLIAQSQLHLAAAN